MTTSNSVVADTTWSNLAALDEEARRAAMTERFRRLASTEETERLRELEAMVRAEYALPEAELHRFTLSRLRAWLQLHEQDRGQASALARAYDAVFQRVPGELAMRRATVVQTVARTELTPEELTALDEMAPTLMQSVAHRPGGTTDLRARTEADTAPRKPRWKFW